MPALHRRLKAQLTQRLFPLLLRLPASLCRQVHAVLFQNNNTHLSLYLGIAPVEWLQQIPSSTNSPFVFLRLLRVTPVASSSFAIIGLSVRIMVRGGITQRSVLHAWIRSPVLEHQIQTRRGSRLWDVTSNTPIRTIEGPFFL
ncbi:hypothetical protein PF007_g2458 [Phytophthora fragariae]|uniref:Secreted protein n=1 Tax=Phytophthora fragariae TaxID=53985 RepID=A0A6A3THE5_9STRA|nr:hypothetical protein PF007_g2458 [Phytophthora fragariae]